MNEYTQHMTNATIDLTKTAVESQKAVQRQGREFVKLVLAQQASASQQGRDFVEKVGDQAEEAQNIWLNLVSSSAKTLANAAQQQANYAVETFVDVNRKVDESVGTSAKQNNKTAASSR